MLLSDDTAEDTQTYVSRRKQGRMTLLRHLTVKLTGTVSNASFTGSGVILRIDKPKTVYLLTAKHNLHVAGGQRTGTTLTDYFKDKIEVEFTSPQDQATRAGIKSIDVLDSDTRNRGYDLMSLEVEDLNFYRAVSKFLAPAAKTVVRHFASHAWQGGSSSRIIDVLDLADAREALGVGASYFRDPRFERCVLLQLGWGLDHSNRHSFEYRALRVVRLESRTYLQTTHESFEDVYTFATDDGDTTREGDSGGPIFALDERGRHAWLVGITLGANFYANKSDPPNNTTIYNNAFSIVSTEGLRSKI